MFSVQEHLILLRVYKKAQITRRRRKERRMSDNFTWNIFNAQKSQMVAIVVGPAWNEQTKQTQSETISEIFGVESEELYCYLI